MVQINKAISIYIIVILSILSLSGCFYKSYENDSSESQTMLALTTVTIPPNEIHDMDGIKYRIVSDDYLQTDLLEEYNPEFIMANEDPETGTYDMLTASREGLIANTIDSRKDEVGKQFGYATTAEEALKSAVEIIHLYYPPEKQGYDCIEREQPFYICYNSNANAWIISGTNDLSVRNNKNGNIMIHGCVCLAIEKDTGILLMITHTAA